MWRIQLSKLLYNIKLDLIFNLNIIGYSEYTLSPFLWYVPAILINKMHSDYIINLLYITTKTESNMTIIQRVLFFRRLTLFKYTKRKLRYRTMDMKNITIVYRCFNHDYLFLSAMFYHVFRNSIHWVISASMICTHLLTPLEFVAHVSKFHSIIQLWFTIYFIYKMTED